MRDFAADIKDDADWDLPELAGRALLALGLDDEGKADLVLPAVTVVDAFLRSVASPFPRSEVLREKYPILKELLYRGTVVREDVIAWYRDFLEGAKG